MFNSYYYFFLLKEVLLAKKVTILNCSPRKNFNTAKMLHSAEDEAKKLGAQVKYVDLINVNYKGCVSCFACKRKGSTTNGLCAFKDDLRPILQDILESDAVIIGSPIYYSFPTGMFRNLLERMLFAAGTYMKDESTGFTKRVLKKTIPVGLIFTMNITKELFPKYNYDTILDTTAWSVRMLFGHCETYNAYDTYQFTNYDNYDCDLFDKEQKAKVRDTQFVKDLQEAKELTKRLLEFK